MITTVADIINKAAVYINTDDKTITVFAQMKAKALYSYLCDEFDKPYLFDESVPMIAQSHCKFCYKTAVTVVNGWTLKNEFLVTP